MMVKKLTLKDLFEHLLLINSVQEYKLCMINYGLNLTQLVVEVLMQPASKKLLKNQKYLIKLLKDLEEIQSFQKINGNKLVLREQ